MAKKKRESSVLETTLGALWFVLEPLFDMIIYYFIVVIIFKRGQAYGVNPFIFIMLGIVHFKFFHAVLNSGMHAVVGNESILKQLLIEPMVFMAIKFYQALLDFRIAFICYLGLFILLEGRFSFKFLCYPLIFAVLVLLAWSLGVLAGTLTVFFRDLPRIVNVLMRLALYLSAIFYPITFLPEQYQGIFLYNPIACVFNIIQWSLLNIKHPPIVQIISLIVIVLLLFVVSHYAYNSLKYKFTKYL